MKHRAWVLTACVLVLATVMLLAPALRHLRFEPARPLRGTPDALGISVTSGAQIAANASVAEILLLWLAIVLPVVLIALLLTPELRKRVLQQVIRFALFVLTLVLALRYRFINLPEIDAGDLASQQGGFTMPVGPAEIETFAPPVLPPWVTYLVSLLLVTLLALGAYLIHRFWQRRHSRHSHSFSAIAAVARNSLDDLAAGRQWGDVIVEAYTRMTEAIHVARGLDRDASSTPREFAVSLSRKGLPASAVNELTRLFEAARYGGVVADETARHRASACLESILQACGVTP